MATSKTKDSESLLKDTDDVDKSSDDLHGLFQTIIQKSKLKIAMMLFITIILINTDAFIEYILILIPGTSIAGCPTTRGSVIQALIITVIFILTILLFDDQGYTGRKIKTE